MIRLPVKQYGWGLRKMEETCGPAFLGAMETAIPYMSEIAPIMEGVWGGVECWGGVLGGQGGHRDKVEGDAPVGVQRGNRVERSVVRHVC